MVPCLEDSDGTTSQSIAQSHCFIDILFDWQTSMAKFKKSPFNWRSWIPSSSSKSKASIVFFYCCIFLWGYPTYIFWPFTDPGQDLSSYSMTDESIQEPLMRDFVKSLLKVQIDNVNWITFINSLKEFLQIMPVSFYTLWIVHAAFLFGNTLMWFLFLKASMMDPGCLLQDTDEYYHAIRQMASLNYCTEGRESLKRLCHTCHLVKPLRAKHCHMINRCVAGFDHYCPFIYNTVGYKNRPYFVGFLATMCLNSLVGIYLCWNWFYVMGRNIFIGIGFLFLSVIALISALMASMCVYMAAVNLTTRECLNPTKYTYLLNNQGKFFNPFDRGIILNFMEFLHIIEPLTQNELNQCIKAIGQYGK